MAGIGTLASVIFGGLGEGRQRRFEDEMAQKQLAQTGEYQSEQNRLEQERIDAQAAQVAASNRTQGLDASGQPLPPLPLPKSLTQIAPNNKGQAATADDYINHYLGLAANATQNNRPDLADRYTAIANAYGLGGYRAAETQDIYKGKIPLQQSQANEQNARAGYYKNVLGVNKSIAEMRDATQRAIASGHDSTHIQTAQTMAAGMLQRANVSAQAQEEGRILSGYFSLQGADVRSAAQQAVEAVRAAENYAATQGKATGVFDPTQGQTGAWNGQPLSLNVINPGAPGGGNTDTSMLGAMAILSAFQQARQNGRQVTQADLQNAIKAALAKNNNAPPNPNAKESPAMKAAVSAVRTALQKKGSEAEIRAALAARKFTPQEIDTILQQAKGTGALQPLAVPTQQPATSGSAASQLGNALKFPLNSAGGQLLNALRGLLGGSQGNPPFPQVVPGL